jgi:parallel beta-helix repeat protein
VGRALGIIVVVLIVAALIWWYMKKEASLAREVDIMRRFLKLLAFVAAVALSWILCRTLTHHEHPSPPVPMTTPPACSGVTVNPGDNLQSLVTSNPPGTTFCIQPGVHHDSVIPKSGDVFTGLPGAIESGSTLLTNWQHVVIAGTPYWTVAGPALLTSTQNAGICQTAYPGCYLSNRMWVNNVSYPSVLRLATATPGSFYYEANGLNSVTVVNGGSGYNNNDILTVNGGATHQGGLGTVQVSASNGKVTGIQAVRSLGDSYPTTPTVETVKGGAGSGCTLNVVGGSRGIQGNVYVSDGENPNTKTTEMSQYATAFRSPIPASASNAVNNVVIQGLKIMHYGPDIQGGSVWLGWYNNQVGTGYDGGWTVQNNEVAFNHIGIAVQGGADTAQILNNSIHDNGIMEFQSSGGAMNLLVSGNNIYNGNREHVSCGWACTFKVSGHGPAGPADPMNAMFSHNTMHDCPGNGMWSDNGATGVTYDHNTIYNMDGPGIQIEVSWHNTVTNNTFYGNGTCAQKSCTLNQGNFENILCSNCSETTITGNTIQWNYVSGGAWGIGIVHSVVRDHEHPGWTVPQNMHVSGNKIIVPAGYPMNRPIVNMNDNENNFSWQAPGIFTANCYQVASQPWAATQWTQRGANMTFTSWKAGGQDVDGTLAAVCP